MSPSACDLTVAPTERVEAGLNPPLQALYRPALSSLGASVVLPIPYLSHQVGGAGPLKTQLRYLSVTVGIQGLYCQWLAMQYFHRFAIGAR